MAGQSDYLPPGLRHNCELWPQEYQDLENLDLYASGQNHDLYARRIIRTKVLVALEEVPERYWEHFKAVELLALNEAIGRIKSCIPISFKGVYRRKFA